MSGSLDKENRKPYPPSFAKKAARKAVSRSATPNSNQIDKVVESVANATKRLSQQSAHSASSKRKAENRIGPWRLGRTLGKGSTGRVRLAKNTLTGKLAAIKIVPKNIIDLEADSNDNQSHNTGNRTHPQKKKKKQKVDENGLPYGIEREIIIMKLISHPNIMALYDVWENKNELFLVLEYVEGGELFDFLINNGKLNERDAVKYFRMIISGVSYCHKFNICHRDLKPENILLDKNGKIKIADFGMAALETQQKLLETSCGSPHYASPEIVAGKNYHGSPSDVWSCGVILFALLTGHLPFDDSNIRKLLLKVQTGKFHMPLNLSNEAKDLIWSMLRVDPNQRIKIENICNHPLMQKYPDFTNDHQIEDKLDHLDISKPIKLIDPDILNNLQTLWHGAPQSHIIKMLQNGDKNPEKMFYYLLENYKLTHTDAINPSALKTSISKTNLKSEKLKYNNQSSDHTPLPALPRSTSTVITTIQDADGKILQSQVQELKPSNSSSKTASKLKHKSSNSRIAASNYNKSISFKKLRKDTSASTLSIVNMNRNLSFLNHDKSLLNLNQSIRNPNIKPASKTSSRTLAKPEAALSTAKKINDFNSSIDNSDLSNSKSFTVNPKDLPDLPDFNDYKYLVNSIFADDSNSASFAMPSSPSFVSSSTSSLPNSKSKPDKTFTKSTTNHNRVSNDMVILNITDTSLSTNDENLTSNYTSSLDPKHNSSYIDTSGEKSQIEDSFFSKDSNILSLDTNSNNHNTDNSTDKSNNTSNLTHTDHSQISKLEALRQELGNSNPANTLRSAKYASLKSIGSNSTRRLNSFLQDGYKNVKVEEYNKKHNHLNSVSNSHKTQPSIDSKDMSDASYSLHSAVEVKILTPSKEELQNLHDGRIFEDADESHLNKKLISDSEIKNNNKKIYQKVAPNIDMRRQSDIRTSLLTTSSTLKDNETVKPTPNQISNSNFDDAEELIKPKVLNPAHTSTDTDITGSLYTTVEEQPQLAPKKTSRPFSEFTPGIRQSMTPTPDSDSLQFAPQSHFKASPVEAECVAIKSSSNTDHKTNISGANTNTAKEHPYRGKVSTNLNPRPMEKSDVRNDSSEAFRKPKGNETKKLNWFRKLFSALSIKHPENNSPTFFNSKKNIFSTNNNNAWNNKKKSKFSFNFNKSKYTPKSSLFVSEYWIESDTVTRERLLCAIKSDSTTNMLKLIDSQKTDTGYNYTFEVSNLPTRLLLDIVDKVGGEYGFGGCYVKVVNLKGTKMSFNYWCTIIKTLVEDLEKEEDIDEVEN